MATTTASTEPDSYLLTLPISVLEYIVSLDPFPWAPVSRQLSSIATSPYVRVAWLLRFYISTQPHLPVLSLQELEQRVSKENFDSIVRYMEYNGACQFGFLDNQRTFPSAPSEVVEITENEAKLLPSRMTTTHTERRIFLIPSSGGWVRDLTTVWCLCLFRVWIDQTFPFTSKLPPLTFFSKDIITILLRRREATKNPDDRAEIDSFFAYIFAYIVTEPDNPILQAFAQLPDLARTIPPTQLARIVEYATRHAPADLVPILLQNYYISPPVTTATFVDPGPRDPVPFLAEQNMAWNLLIRQNIPALTVLVERGGHTCYVNHVAGSMLEVYFAAVWPGDLSMVQILLRGSERVFEGAEDGESNKLSLVLSPAIEAAIKYLQPISITALLVSNIHPASMAEHIPSKIIEAAFQTSRLLPDRINPYELVDFMLSKVPWTVDDIKYIMDTFLCYATDDCCGASMVKVASIVKVARELVARGVVVKYLVNGPEELVRVVTGVGV